MSTQPRIGALDLFVTDAAAHRWRRVTSGANLRGLGVQLRFVTDARAVRNRPDVGHKLVSRSAASGSAETVLIDDAVFAGAAATPHDRALLITSDARSAGSTDNAWQYRVLRLPDASTRVDVPPAVERVAVWVDPGP
jgi:hypothetical protein